MKRFVQNSLHWIVECYSTLYTRTAAISLNSDKSRKNKLKSVFLLLYSTVVKVWFFLKFAFTVYLQFQLYTWAMFNVWYLKTSGYHDWVCQYMSCVRISVCQYMSQCLPYTLLPVSFHHITINIVLFTWSIILIPILKSHLTDQLFNTLFKFIVEDPDKRSMKEAENISFYRWRK